LDIRSYKTLRKERFDYIDFPDNLYYLNRSKRNLSLGTDKNISSFDFEVLTHQEKTYPVMLGYSTVDTHNKVIDEGIIDKINIGKHKRQRKSSRPDLYNCEDKNKILDSILQEMVKIKYASNLNFFYNIGYDMSILLSLFPNKKQLELYDFQQTKYILNGEELDIFIIPKKLISIKRGKHTIKFYDLASFLYQSLDNACKEWLGKRKLNFDTKGIMNDLERFKKHYKNNEIQEYCLVDCRLTSKLAFEVRKHFSDMGIPFSKPVSPAGLSKDYTAFNDEIDIPNYQKFHMQKLAYQGYYGGLFEFFQRGFFKNAKGYDVDSLYPSIMKDLPDLRDCDVRFNTEVDPKADYAVIKARVWLKDQTKISPFSSLAKISYKDIKGYKKTQEKIIRPIFKGQETVMTKQMYDFITKGSYPYLKKLQIQKCYNIYTDKNTRKPFSYLQKLFNIRVDLLKKYGKEDKREKIIKIILNSIYGATAEVVKRPKIKYDEKQKEYLLEGVEYKAGDLFRPFIAFHTTELSRLKMYKAIYNSKIEDQVIGVATDCIYIKEEGCQKFEDNNNVNDRKELGSYSIDYQGDMLIVGNGIYQVKTGENIKGGWSGHHNIVIPKIKIRSRGFNEKEVPILFHNSIYDDKTELIIKNKRPLSFKEVMFAHNKNADKIGLFVEDPKRLNINMDRSRLWERKIKDIKDLKTSQINSSCMKLPSRNYYYLKNGQEKDIIKVESKRLKEVLKDMDKRYKDIELFKSNMILLDQPREYFKTNDRKDLAKHWITWKGRKVMIVNESIFAGEVPKKWQGYNFNNMPWKITEDRKGIRQIILTLLKEREEMIDQELQILKNELEQGKNPEYIQILEVNDHKQAPDKIKNAFRTPSANPKWFLNPEKYYNWYSLQSSLAKKRVYSAIENENDYSQLYQDLRYLAHKILFKGDRYRDYPADKQYRDLIYSLDELYSEIRFEHQDKKDKFELEIKEDPELVYYLEEKDFNKLNLDFKEIEDFNNILFSDDQQEEDIMTVKEFEDFTIKLLKHNAKKYGDDFTKNQEKMYRKRKNYISYYKIAHKRSKRAGKNKVGKEVIREDIIDDYINTLKFNKLLEDKPVKDRPIYYLNESQYLKRKGVETVWIAEISPMQYANISKRQRKKYDKEQNKKWKKSSETKQEFKEKIISNYNKGNFSLKDPVPNDVRNIIKKYKRKTKNINKENREYDRKKILQKVNSLDQKDLEKGMKVYISNYGYRTLTKVNKKTVRFKSQAGKHKTGKAYIKYVTKYKNIDLNQFIESDKPLKQVIKQDFKLDPNNYL